MASVKNELARLKKRVSRKVMPTGAQVEAYGIALADRITRKMRGEDVSSYQMPPLELPEAFIAGSRERLALKILEIAERREKADARAERESKATADERAIVAGVARGQAGETERRMQEIDEQTKGVRTPVRARESDHYSPILEALKKRKKQFSE
jgi:hypothetical protein